jgi:hypothetical protein
MKAKLLIMMLFLQVYGVIAQPVDSHVSTVYFNLFEGSNKVSGIISSHEFSTTHFLWFGNIDYYLNDLKVKDSLDAVSVYYHHEHNGPTNYTDSSGFIMYVIKTYQEYVEPQWGANRFLVKDYSIMAIEFPNIYENYFVDSLIFSPGYFKAIIKSNSEYPFLEETQRPFKTVELKEKYGSGIADKIFRGMYYTQKSHNRQIIETQLIPEQLHFLEKALDLEVYELIHGYMNKCLTDSAFNSTDFFCLHHFQEYYDLDTEDQLQNKINNLMDSLYIYAVNTGDYHFEKWKEFASLESKKDALEAYEYALTIKPEEIYLKTQIENLK